MARFTLDTDAQFDQTLNELATTIGSTKAEVLRRAVATYKYLKTEDQIPNNRVSITQNGNVVKDIILP